MATLPFAHSSISSTSSANEMMLRESVRAPNGVQSTTVNGDPQEEFFTSLERAYETMTLSEGERTNLVSFIVEANKDTNGNRSAFLI